MTAQTADGGGPMWSSPSVGRWLAAATPYLMLAPAAVFLLGISIYPFLFSARVSLDSYTFGQGTFVGLQNYSLLLRDSYFWSALQVTVLFTASAVAVEGCLGLAMALLMAREGKLFERLRIIYILPMVIAPIVVGIIWRLLYATGVGALPYLASLIGIRDFSVLSSPTLALPALVLVDVWEWTPFMFLVLLAGIQSLPSEPFEAARVDGANAGQIFLTLTLPMLRPVILVALLVRTMDAFTIFDQVFVLTNGGPGVSTQVISLYAYNTAFRFSQLGYGAAIVFCMLLFVVAVSTFLIRLMRRNLATR